MSGVGREARQETSGAGGEGSDGGPVASFEPLTSGQTRLAVEYLRDIAYISRSSDSQAIGMDPNLNQVVLGYLSEIGIPELNTQQHRDFLNSMRLAVNVIASGQGRRRVDNTGPTNFAIATVVPQTQVVGVVIDTQSPTSPIHDDIPTATLVDDDSEQVSALQRQRPN